MSESVNHPKHYNDGKIEVIEFLEDKNLGFHLGNAVKYISRAGKKDPSKTHEDLDKAIWYIKRYQEIKFANKPCRPNELTETEASSTINMTASECLERAEQYRSIGGDGMEQIIKIWDFLGKKKVLATKKDALIHREIRVIEKSALLLGGKLHVQIVFDGKTQ